MTSPEIRPIKRTISVSWDPETAFRKFTAGFGDWWPKAAPSIGGDRIKRVVFEEHVGGRIYEEHADGRRFQWGKVILWEPPRRVSFSWHSSRDPSTAEDVEIQFLPEGIGTSLQLTSTGLERFVRRARRAWKRYNLGWGYVLSVWAGRRTLPMYVLEATCASRNLTVKFRGGRNRIIAQAGGEIHSE